jgi:putative phage-type endonuclease
MSAVETPCGIHLGTWTHNDPEWHAARLKGIGGSEISAVLGLSPFDSPYSLWCKKRGLITTEVTAQMRWGNYAEPALLAWYHDEIGHIAKQPGTFRHDARSYQIANPDGLRPDRIVEAKTAIAGWQWGPPGTDEAPPYYRCQALWYEDTLGLDLCDIIASLGGKAPEVWTIKYDADDAEFMREKAKDFLDLVDSGIEPDLDGHEETYRAVRALHPDIDPGAEWHLDDDKAEPFLKACADEKVAKAAKREAAARILKVMGQAQYAVHNGKRIASRQTKGAGTPFLKAASN